MGRDAQKVFTESVFDSDEHHHHLLAERGGLLARGFYQMRRKLGDVLGVSLITSNEFSREELIAYHESKCEPRPGIVWDDPEEEEANRLLR